MTPSSYRSASKDTVQLKLSQLISEKFPFTTPLLQKDTFWLYTNARRHFGTWKAACIA